MVLLKTSSGRLRGFCSLEVSTCAKNNIMTLSVLLGAMTINSFECLPGQCNLEAVHLGENTQCHYFMFTQQHYGIVICVCLRDP